MLYFVFSFLLYYLVISPGSYLILDIYCVSNFEQCFGSYSISYIVISSELVVYINKE
jgi:hypothetical protein